MRKLNLKILGFTLLTAASCFIHQAVFAGSKIQVAPIGCTSGDGKNIVVPSMGLHSVLGAPQKGKTLRLACEKVTWKNLTFIGVRYDSQQTITYSGKEKAFTNYDIFHVVKKIMTHKVATPTEGLTTEWQERRGHIVLRMVAMRAGKKEFLEGYLFNPKKENFVDLGLFAYENKWPSY